MVYVMDEVSKLEWAYSRAHKHFLLAHETESNGKYNSGLRSGRVWYQDMHLKHKRHIRGYKRATILLNGRRASLNEKLSLLKKQSTTIS